MMTHVLGIRVGNRVDGTWIVQDISYSQDEKYIYLHMSQQLTPRRKPRFRVEKFRPFDRVDYNG